LLLEYEKYYNNSYVLEIDSQSEIIVSIFVAENQ